MRRYNVQHALTCAYAMRSIRVHTLSLTGDGDVSVCVFVFVCGNSAKYDGVLRMVLDSGRGDTGIVIL
jgi:hypothetical protein